MLLGRDQAPDPARDRARLDPARDHHAHHARVGARRAERGLRAHGAREGPRPAIVDRRHVLRNAMLPISTIIGLQTGLLLSGAVLTETVFEYPGMGYWIAQAIFNRDYPVLQGGILFLAFVFVHREPRRRHLLRLHQPADQVQLMSIARTRSPPSSRSRRRPAGSGARPGRRLQRNPGAIVGAIFVADFVVVAHLRAADRAVRRRSRSPSTCLATCCPGPSRRALVRHRTSSGRTRSRASSTARGSRSSSASSRSPSGSRSGCSLGAIAGYVGGLVDSVIMRCMDMHARDPGPAARDRDRRARSRSEASTSIMVAIGVTNIPIFARLLRGSILAQRDNDFVLAARSVGVQRPTILFAHILPNAISAGDRPGHARAGDGDHRRGGARLPRARARRIRPRRSGGRCSPTRTTTSAARRCSPSSPGVAILISVLGFNLIGDGLREALDPKLRGRVERQREPLLAVDDLRVQFWTSRGTVYAVNGISFDIAPRRDARDRRRVRLREERHRRSRSSASCRARAAIPTGTAIFEGRDLLASLRPARCAAIRGTEIAMIFQDPMTSLNPVLTIGKQIREALEAHFDMNKKEANEPRGRAARPGRDPEPEDAAQGLPAPVLGRDAAARDDRDGARVRAEAADRRRAHDRARRDDPGADPRPAARARCGGERGADHDHARPRRRCRHVRARERHVLGHVRGDRRRRRSSSRSPRHPYTLGLLESVPRLDALAQDASSSRSRASRATCSSRRPHARSSRAAATRSTCRARRCRRWSRSSAATTSPASTRCPADEWAQDRARRRPL